MLDIRLSDRREEARRTAALLEAVASEAERLGQRQADPALRRALLDQVARARADAAELLGRLDAL
jgi:HEAT repeat protein